MSYRYRYGAPAKRGHKGNGIVKPDDRPDVARRIASIMAQQRHGKSAPDFGMRAGRVDRRRLGRAKSDPRVFTTRTAASTSRLRVVVILDLSGSMMGERVNAAVQTAWDFALAASYMPTVTLEVWGHGTAYTKGYDDRINDEAESVREGSFIACYELYRPGMTLAQFYAQFKGVDLCGNEDGFALQSIGAEVMRRASKDERVLFIMVSDGAPIYKEGMKAWTHVGQVVKALRSKGAAVVGVSISSALGKDVQAKMYGKHVIIYDHNPSVTTTNMGRVIGQAMNG
jgi:cobalamin biosynthesis protein CobT